MLALLDDNFSTFKLLLENPYKMKRKALSLMKLESTRNNMSIEIYKAMELSVF